MNDISLTIRLPHSISQELSCVSKKLGMTRTNFIRLSIHDLLTKDEIALDFSFLHQNEKKDRMVLNINPLIHGILETTCKKHNQSMNSIVTAVSLLALKRATKWLE